MSRARACRICGCTCSRACEGGCSWVERDLCSACVTSTIAYCYRSGHIEFGNALPAGALPLAHGKDKLVRQHISVTARLAYDNKTLLVPGIPEAKDDSEARAALVAHLRWLKKRERKGFKVAIREGA